MPTQTDKFDYNITVVPLAKSSDESCIPVTYGAIEKDSVWIRSNDAEHRGFPEGHLFLSPTGQLEQFTQKTTMGQISSEPQFFPNACGLPQGVTVTYFSYPQATPLEGPADPRWRTRLRLKIKDESVNIAESVAEYRETARLFRDFAIGARDAWRVVRGKKIPRRHRGDRYVECELANTTLLADFGISPLVSDLEDSFFALNNAFSKPIYKRFKVKAATTKSVSDPLTTAEGQWDCTEWVTAYVELEPQPLGPFDFGNPLELAWELTPFSFVVDWGIGVGDYLSALDALKSVKSSIGTVTRKAKYEGTALHLTDFYSVPLRHAKCIKETHRRYVFTDIPVPELPTYEPSDSWNALRDGVALLTTISEPCSKQRFILP